MKALILFCGFSLAVWGANGRVYDYDEAGNMIARNGQILAYDEQNNLRQVGFVFYLYNDSGERVRKISFAGETVWIDDIYEREPGRTLCHVQAGGQRIVTFSADGSEFYYYHSDHLGSSSLVTDQDGSLVRQQYGYRAFGSERFSLNILPSFTSRFTGQPFDTETGLYYYQSRYYDPELGRFIQPDSIVPDPGSSQSLNRYSYVLNNPLKYIDPTGHAEQPIRFIQGSGSLGFGAGPNWLVGGAGGSLGFGTGPNWLGLYGGAGGWLGAGVGRDWLGLGWQAGGYRTSELPSTMADPYAHWDYSRKPSAGENVKTVASVALLAVPNSAVVRIIGATLRVARVARMGAFGVTRMALMAKNGKSLLRGEGAVGVYDDLIAAGSKGDNLTPHHIPSAQHMAGKGISRGRGVSIMMEHPVPGIGGRHRATFTYGTTADVGMTSRNALAAGIRDARRIYMQDGLYSPHIRRQLQEVIRQNKTLYPSFFAK